MRDFFIFFIKGVCPVTQKCVFCSSHPTCSLYRFRSGLRLCLDEDSAMPENEYVTLIVTWPRDCGGLGKILFYFFSFNNISHLTKLLHFCMYIYVCICACVDVCQWIFLISCVSILWRWFVACGGWGWCWCW